LEEKRYDSVVAKTYLQNYSTAARKTSGVELNDFNCGLKAKKYSGKNIEVSGEMHRYIPVLAKNGFKNRRKSGATPSRKYGKLNLEWNVSSMDS
jgi:hypothetical protein